MTHIHTSVDRSWHPAMSSRRNVLYLNMRTLATFLFVVCVGLVSTVPVISDFDPDQRVIFTDDASENSYFHYINFDPQNSSRIYIGALDFVYRLNADNISSNSLKSDNITNTAGFQPMRQYSVAACRESNIPEPKLDYHCRSHVRAVLPINGELYVCATGYYNPQEFYLNDRLKVVAVMNNTDDPVGAGSGVSKCPKDPNSPYTILSVGQTSPRLLPAIYSTLFISSGYDPTIYRSSLRQNRNAPLEFYQLRSQPFSDSDVTFVATYEIEQFVYFFYREIAVEASSCGRFRYSRVARVCKNDIGGGVDPNKFLTFVKARIVCSVSSGDDIPIYYNELYDVQYNATERVFYGLFKMNKDDLWGSAVCRFRYTDITYKFEQGQFLSQDTPSSPWTITPDQQVPKPRLSMCLANVTTSLPSAAQIFGLTHYLMADAIAPMDGGPLYYSQDVGYSRLVVDFVRGLGRSYTVFLLFSEKRPDEIVRVVQWNEGEQLYSKQFSVLKPFSNYASCPDQTACLWNMVLHKSSQKNWLYVVKDKAVFQLSTVLCSQYKLCTECAMDPYCGWNSITHVCLPFGRTGLIQNVESSSALTACNAVCKVTTIHQVPFIPGMPVHLNCSSYCSPESNVTWHWYGASSSIQLLPSQSPNNMQENYILSQDGSLVILNFVSSLEGTLACKSNGVTLAEHTIKASPCNYTGAIQTTFLQEFRNWCDAFGKYREDYNNWICLKDCLGTFTNSQPCRARCTKN